MFYLLEVWIGLCKYVRRHGVMLRPFWVFRRPRSTATIILQIAILTTLYRADHELLHNTLNIVIFFCLILLFWYVRLSWAGLGSMIWWLALAWRLWCFPWAWRENTFTVQLMRCVSYERLLITAGCLIENRRLWPETCHWDTSHHLQIARTGMLLLRDSIPADVNCT
jgi:hypothetical protein